MAFTGVIIIGMFAIAVVSSYPREVVVEEDNPVIKTINIDRIIKKITGHCIKLGRSTRGCVSGNYLHAFHPDCM
ncbi:hypothetical protein RI129_007795 [Pyrocoelia pectoralis]|uniref:Uncharacterized protein n=1 Tax=Pyrocoelia pectoralis TaxID=417401 RepID=A0AAN7V8U7_9COLE